MQKTVLNQAIGDTRHVLAGSDAPPEVDGKYKKLFDMSFMKRARDSQQEKAMDEAKALLHEIAEMEANDDSDDDVDAPRRKQKSAEELKALEEAKAQMNEMLGGVFKSGKTTAQSISNANNPWLKENAKPERQITKSNKRSAEPVLSVTDDSTRTPVSNSLSTSKKSKVVTSSGKTSATAKTVITPQTDSAAPSLKKRKVETVTTSVTESSAPAKKQLVEKKTQEELVHMAFAGPDYEEDFAQIKQRMVDDELNIDEKKIKALAEGKLEVLYVV